MGALVVAILIVLALATSLSRMDRETVDRSVAYSLGTRILERVLRDIRYGSAPPVAETDFWANDYPAGSGIESGTVRLGATDYAYEVWATTVRDSAGTPIGSLATNNVLKRVTVRINWFVDPDQARAGYGLLETRVTRLVHQGEPW